MAFFTALAFERPWPITQTLSPVAFRATACAFTSFMVNSVGLGLGPQAMGIISAFAGSASVLCQNLQRLGQPMEMYALHFGMVVFGLERWHLALGGR